MLTPSAIVPSAFTCERPMVERMEHTEIDFLDFHRASCRNRTGDLCLEGRCVTNYANDAPCYSPRLRYSLASSIMRSAVSRAVGVWEKSPLLKKARLCESRPLMKWP